MKNYKSFFSFSCVLLGLTLSFIRLTSTSPRLAKAEAPFSAHLSISSEDKNEDSASTNSRGNIAVEVPFDGDGSVGDTYLSVYFNKTEYCDELDNITPNVIGASSTPYVHVKDYVTSKVFLRPTTTSTYNTVDYLYYMLGILEDYATGYLTSNSSSSPSIATVNNLMLGYLRSFNNAYYAGYGQKWELCAGEIDSSFCNYVTNNESSQTRVKLPEFFASFLQSATDYNTSLHGTIDASFLNKHYLLQDPLGSGQGIDLIHMFAAMDGIYKYTGANTLALYMYFQQDHQHDLVSWLGDLHTFAKDVFYATGHGADWHDIRDYQASDGHINFNEFVGNGIKLDKNGDPLFPAPTTFSSNDLIADLDAMNITRIFIDHQTNSLRDCIMAYYKIMCQDNSLYGNRYYEFIYTCTRSLEWTSTGDLLTDFQRELYRSLNLERSSAGGCSSVEYYAPSSYDMKLLVLNDQNQLPNLGVLRYCANLFYDYITIMSHRFDD